MKPHQIVNFVSIGKKEVFYSILVERKIAAIFDLRNTLLFE